jgi:AraC-like DNA-binding protein
MLDAIQRELDSDQVGNLRAAQAYIALLSVWIERQALRLGEEGQKNDAARRLVARFTALMEEKFRSGVGVGLLAAELGVTPTHLTRCCRQTCSRSAIDLLQDRRIFEARKLLAETKLRINVIGTSLGFTSAAYFTRAFQNRTGSSPREFRRNL